MTGPRATATPATADPDADRHGPLAGVGEDVGEDRQRRRHDQRGADAHHRAGRDQRVDAAGERGGRRADAEDDEAEGERALPPEAVAEAAGGEQQAGEHERVGVDDPLELAGGRAEVAHQGRQRHVEDRVVDDDHEQAEAQHAEGEPAAIGGSRTGSVAWASSGRSSDGGMTL